MPTRKTSVALGVDELAAAKRAAAAEGMSLSAFLTMLVRAHVEQQERFDAMGRFLKTHGGGFRVSERARAAIEAEWNAPLAPVRSRRTRSVA